MQTTYNNKALLILDLDETLIHSCLTERGRKPDLLFENFMVYKRPGLDSFLNQMHKIFLLAIWSTGTDDYVNEIAQAITPDGCRFEFVWGRSRCTVRNVELKNISNKHTNTYDYIKPLKKVKRLGYSLKQTLIVDDSAYKCTDNYGNAIYIKAFEGDINDRELPKLANYLKQLQPEPNYRKIEKRGWNNS